MFSQFSSAQQHRQLPFQRATDVDRGHAGNAAQFVGQHIFCQPRNLGVALQARRQRHIHDGLRRRVEMPNDGLTHLSREFVARTGDNGADIIRCFNHVLLERKLDPEAGVAFATGRVDLGRTWHALQRLFQSIDDLALHRVWRGARVGNKDLNPRNFNVRVLIDAQFTHGQQAHGHERDDQYDGRRGALDTEVGQKHGYFPCAAAGAD